MTTIAEYPAPEYSVPSRVIKMAVIGGSGVGKTGKKTVKILMLQFAHSVVAEWFILSFILSYNCLTLCYALFLISALVVRFLTRRFIGDYERNAGEGPGSVTSEDEMG